MVGKFFKVIETKYNGYKFRSPWKLAGQSSLIPLTLNIGMSQRDIRLKALRICLISGFPNKIVLWRLRVRNQLKRRCKKQNCFLSTQGSTFSSSMATSSFRTKIKIGVPAHLASPTLAFLQHRLMKAPKLKFTQLVKCLFFFRNSKKPILR